ncbi:MAG: hypothetical protein C0596_02620 [Marinilabiliales bacterium]|nr:MAG: hypothetical protein C0596_02620 [Marinilabiliales bacterium]
MKIKRLLSGQIQVVLVFLLLISASSCQLFQRTSYKKEPKPDWLTSRPQNNMYYFGISSSPKKGYLPSDYMANAQQNALSDLAGGISVNIESTSVLSVMENTYNFNENFSSEISATTNEQLEGYELVDTWEDSDYYWVYYRLLKTKHLQLKLQRKEQSILDSKSKYYQARELLDRDLHYNAFRFYVEALTALKSYLGDCTSTDIYGEEKDLGNEIFSEMAEFVNNLNINFTTKTISVKKGVELDDEVFSFKITDQNGKPV